MQLYTVKLKDTTGWQEKDVMDGYIAHNYHGFKQKFVYDLGGAREKVRKLKGKSEKFGKQYTIDIKKTIVILGRELEKQVVDLLFLNDEQLVDAEFLREHCIRVLQCKTLKVPLTESSRIELMCLMELIMMYDNVKIEWYQR